MPNTGPESSPLHVAVGVIRNAQQQILIAKRNIDKAHGGCWEFPGGKIKQGESPEMALCRELHEELNLEPSRWRPLITVDHVYPHYCVRLHVYYVYKWQGEVHGREGQKYRWVAIRELGEYEYPEANYYILKAINLPEIYFVTPESEIDRSGFLDRCENILQSGCRLVQFRCKLRPFQACESTFRELLRLGEDYGAKVLLNTTVNQALAAGAHGCHLSSANLSRHSCVSLPAGFLVGVSCHNTQQLRQAETINADFAVLGPVMSSQTHPDHEGIGWRRFGELVAETNLPTLAIGGMEISDLERSWDHGAQGIAAVRGIWNSDRGITDEPDLSGKLISA